MSENKVIPVKVALRIRPLVPREKADACVECLRTVNGQQVILGKDKAFTYDNVFSQLSPQVEVYETAVQSLLGALFNGYNATVLAYGQTGSGKTYSMGSGYLSLCSATSNLTPETNLNGAIMSSDFDNVGVIPRVLNDLFTRIEEEQRANKDAKFTVKVSFVEVYNEEIKDLFNPGCTSSGSTSGEPLNIREENNSIRVVNLSEITVTNAITTIQLLEKGSAVRVVGGTAMNDQSSRSHAIFTITLEQERGENELIKSKFHLVDLAGSERQSKTKAEGIRLREGININLGLLALGNVISILGEDNPSNKVKHVPYRESKLTRLLQDSLGGNSHTLMIACVSPADSNMEETLNTLRYADRARKIKNKPIVNIDPQAAELSNLRQQVQELKAQIIQLNGGKSFVSSSSSASLASSDSAASTAELNQLKDEIDKLKIENMKLLSELSKFVHINRNNFERMTLLENERDELKKRLDEVIQMIKDAESVDTAEAVPGAPGPNSSVSLTNKSLLVDLQAKLGEFEQSNKETQNNMENDQELNFDNEPVDKDYALRQAQMQMQLTEYDTELIKKQQLFRRMIENNASSARDDTRIEATLEELKGKIEALEREKEDLQNQLRTGDSRKQNELKRERFKELEGEVLELKKKEREFAKMVRLKEENEKHCEKLKQEIQHIKQERVKLLKQMRADTETFRKYKQEKEKEVNQLKALERKRLVEISKLQEGNNRQEAILRRKNEEISRIQKQLRETSEKQKQVAEKRQQAFDRKETSTAGERLRVWVTQEIEYSVALAEARINLNKLIEARKECAAELARLTERFNEMVDDDDFCKPTSSKLPKYTDMDATYVAGRGTPSINTPSMSNDQSEEYDINQLTRGQVEQRIIRLKEDIECKNIQITEAQQTVIEGDNDDRSKHLFNNVHGLLEAKVLLKHLYNMGVQYLLDSKLKQIQYETTSNCLSTELKELKRKYETTEEDLNKSKKTFNNEINNLHQYYEQRILVLLKSGINDNLMTNDDRFSVLYEQIRMLEKRIDHEQGDKRTLSELTNKDDFKKSQKAKRDHRRTRVIRTLPELENRSNLLGVNIESIDESPARSPYDIVAPTPDDKVKDPDWAKTPIRTKRSSKSTIPKKMTMRRSKSKLQPTQDVEDPIMSNDENK